MKFQHLEPISGYSTNLSTFQLLHVGSDETTAIVVPLGTDLNAFIGRAVSKWIMTFFQPHCWIWKQLHSVISNSVKDIFMPVLLWKWNAVYQNVYWPEKLKHLSSPVRLFKPNWTMIEASYVDKRTDKEVKGNRSCPGWLTKVPLHSYQNLSWKQKSGRLSLTSTNSPHSLHCGTFKIKWSEVLSCWHSCCGSRLKLVKPQKQKQLKLITSAGNTLKMAVHSSVLFEWILNTIRSAF